MSAATDAYAAAQRLIAEAARTGATTLSFNTPDTHALTRLPAEIATLTATTALDLRDTGVSDLTQIATLTALTTLNLNRTRVSDLTPIAALTAITTLELSGTGVTDLRPIATLTALTMLNLWETKVTDLSPIAALTALTKLYLRGPGVTDLTPIAALTALTWLDLGGPGVTDLTPIAALTALTTLRLIGTGVTDLTPLAALTALTTLDLDGTKVTDLRPLLRLEKLASAPDVFKSGDHLSGGLSFTNTQACQDPSIAAIAAIRDPATRARTLFDYLQDWVPPPYVEERASATDHVTATVVQNVSALRREIFLPTVAKLTTTQLTKVLKDSYPDLRGRTQHLVSMIQQERAEFALIPIPNDAERLTDHRHKEAFLQTILAGLVSLYDDLPEMSDPESRPSPKKLKDSLVALAGIVDNSITYLDSHEGTYGSLWKLGLVTGCAGLLALFPGVSFLPATVVTGTVIGAQSFQIILGRIKEK